MCYEYLKALQRSITTYTVFDLITTHTPISAQLSNSVVFRLQPVYFWDPFELHRLVHAIQMGTYNICFYKENQGKKTNKKTKSQKTKKKKQKKKHKNIA